MGGYIYVTYFKNRLATQDLDYIFDPQLPRKAKVQNKLRYALNAVALPKGLSREWVDDKIANLTCGKGNWKKKSYNRTGGTSTSTGAASGESGGCGKRSSTRRRYKSNDKKFDSKSNGYKTSTLMRPCRPVLFLLFQESVEQNVVLWKGQNLIVYAVKWEWALIRKLKRISVSGKEGDIGDAVAILHEINEVNGGPLDRTVARAWNGVSYSPVEEMILDEVARRYAVEYGEQGLIG